MTATLPLGIQTTPWIQDRDLDVAYVHDIHPAGCPRCGYVDAVNAVRVYCRTGDESTSWVREECFDCAQKLIGEARNECDDRYGRIPVEIAA